MKKTFVCVNCPKFCQMNHSKLILDKMSEIVAEGYEELEFKCKPAGLLELIKNEIEEKLKALTQNKHIKINLH